MNNAYDYIKDHPLHTESDYSYTARDDNCKEVEGETY